VLLLLATRCGWSCGHSRAPLGHPQCARLIAQVRAALPPQLHTNKRPPNRSARPGFRLAAASMAAIFPNCVRSKSSRHFGRFNFRFRVEFTPRIIQF
jgi:hypothetical protein